MKKLNVLLAYIFLAGMIACESPVTFTEPQPPDTGNLAKIPDRLAGKYYSLADNSLLTISDNLLVRTYDFDNKMHINDLDSNMRLSGDTLVDLKSHERTIVIRVGDTLVNHIHATDTVFQLNKDNVLRKFKGYYFLNKRMNDESWEVKKISISRGQITIGSISSKFDLEKLQEITETSKDTVPPHKFTVTKKQFRKFIRRDGFSENEIFIRQ
ncbi:MAG: hypothetical protein HXX13_09290 [Bacteroidetes bacterium]|nr:hypothetical protein [Bacteroidota bacterium]